MRVQRWSLTRTKFLMIESTFGIACEGSTFFHLLVTNRRIRIGCIHIFIFVSAVRAQVEEHDCVRKQTHISFHLRTSLLICHVVIAVSSGALPLLWSFSETVLQACNLGTEYKVMSRKGTNKAM